MHPSYGAVVDIAEAGPWHISAGINGRTREFIRCNAERRTPSNDLIMFHADRSPNLYFSIVSDRLNLTRQQYRSFIKIDRSVEFELPAIRRGNNHALIDIESSTTILKAIAEGVTFFVDVGNVNFAFPLDDSTKMLGYLFNCAKHAPDRFSDQPNQALPPVAPTPPPQVAATPAPAQKPRGANFGSGFFVRSEGSGITNAHVVNGCTTATIEGYGRARITARDKTNALALVQLTEPKRTEAVQFARRSLKLGEFVYALGFPLPGIIDNGLNFTGGQVSSLSGLGGDTRHFQLSAPIQPGNSGGPVVNTSGQLVGVTRARLDDVATLEASGSLPQNVNYAIRSDIAASFLRANGIDPSESESAAKLEPTDIATAGRGYTFQIRCTVE